MIAVDSSGWIQYLTDGPLAESYEQHLSDLNKVLTPTIVAFEVYKWVKREHSEAAAIKTAAQLESTAVTPLNTNIAFTAADLSLEHGLAMADAIVYATALLAKAPLVTSDKDFESLPSVVYLSPL